MQCCWAGLGLILRVLGRPTKASVGGGRGRDRSSLEEITWMSQCPVAIGGQLSSARRCAYDRARRNESPVWGRGRRSWDKRERGREEEVGRREGSAAASPCLSGNVMSGGVQVPSHTQGARREIHSLTHTHWPLRGDRPVSQEEASGASRGSNPPSLHRTLPTCRKLCSARLPPKSLNSSGSLASPAARISLTH